MKTYRDPTNSWAVATSGHKRHWASSRRRTQCGKEPDTRREAKLVEEHGEKEYRKRYPCCSSCVKSLNAAEAKASY